MSYGVVIAIPPSPSSSFLLLRAAALVGGGRFVLYRVAGPAGWASRAPGPLQESFPGVLSRGGLAQVLQRLTALVADVLRHDHLDGDQQVAVGSVGPPDTLAPHPEGAAVRGAARDLDRDRGSLVRGHLDVGAQRRLWHRHRDGHGQVAA